MITLTAMGSEGLSLIAALYGAAFGDDWPENSIKSLLDSPGTHALVASMSVQEGGDWPAGFILYRRIADEAEILSIGSHPDLRKIGVATTLLSAVHSAVKTAGATAIFLEVGVDNPAAIALYRKLDYGTVGRRPGYYRRANGQKVDALIMKATLL